MFEQPLILDELDLLYKGDKTKSIVFYYQVISFALNSLQESRIISITATHDRERQRRNFCIKDVQENTKEHNSNELLHEKQRFCSRLVKLMVPCIFLILVFFCNSDSQVLFTTLCNAEPLRGFAIYFMRASTKKSLGEEAFQVLL